MAGSGLAGGRAAALAVAIAAVLAGGTWFAVSGAAAQPSHRSIAAPRGQNQSQAPDGTAGGPLRIVSVTPARGSRRVNGAAPVTVRFSGALAADSPMPVLQPGIPGHWHRAGADTVVFRAHRGYQPLTRVRLTIPGGASGVRSATGGTLAASYTEYFRVGRMSALRMEQLLAELGYLPLTWAAADQSKLPAVTNANAQLSAAYRPPAGTFSWEHGYPRHLKALWHPARGHNEVLVGAIMAFESDHGLTMDGTIGPELWRSVLRATVRGEANVHGYTYALARQATPETLTIWHDGKVVLHSLANTGISVAPTTVGTSPVYLRYRFQIMRGTNPDGSQYADPVSYVSYFRAGEAVHYFPRGSYGFEQSLGCVELPIGSARRAWPYLTYGSLVTVTPIS